MSDKERYDIQGKLGEGGRGAVYLAQDKQLNRTVAIKRLFSDEDSAEKDYEEILHESRALSSINSPHIVRVFDVCQDEEGPYVVMEHLKGKTLHEVVATAPLVEQDFLEIAAQALEALIAAHEVNLLHRDIKPGNLMLTWLPSGRFNLKLLDFGLAKFSATPAVQTVAQNKSVIGSIYFMAPEQFDRKPLDQRTDLYSLGCVFFFALTGEYPFDGANVTEVMASHIQGRHKDLHTVRPDLPASLCEWVTHFIAVDPDDRPATAQEGLDSLDEARRGTFTRVAPQPIAPQLLTGPINVEPPTGAVPGPNLQTSAQIVSTNPTETVPIAGLATGTQPVLTAPKGFPHWLLITMGVLSLLVIVLGAAVLLRPDPDPPAPQTPPPAPAPAPAPDKDINKKPEPPAEKPKPEPKPPKVTKPVDRPSRVIPPSRKELAKSFNSRDRNKDNKIDLKEWLTDKKPEAVPHQTKRFHSFDKNKDGHLTLEEFSTR